jgi:hypothetical protein
VNRSSIHGPTHMIARHLRRAPVIPEYSRDAPFVERSTAFTGVPLEPNGDFRIDETLNPAPSECPSPVLLIRNTGGVWFAAGIPKLGDD